MEAKCHATLTALTKLIIQLCVIFLVGIRITFLCLEDTSAFGLDKSLLLRFIWIFGNLLIIAADIILLCGILNSWNEIVMYCLIYNQIINWMTLIYLLLSGFSWTIFDFRVPNLRFSSSLCVLMFGLNLETSSISLLVLATTIECIRLSLLTLAHMGLNILNPPYQNVLPLWTPQQNNPIEEENGQRNFTGQACSAGGDHVQIN